MATVIDYFTVKRADDGMGLGHYPPTTIAHFLSKSAAEEFADRDRFYYVSDRNTFTVYDTVKEYDAFRSEQAKAAALAKLTAEERVILGL